MNDSDLQKIDQLLQKRLKGFVTKKDIQQFATKEDLKTELSKYATKEDLKTELSKYATKEDIKKLATKADLETGLDELLADIIEAVDKSKAEKAQVVKLEKRVNRIEEDLQIPTQQ